MEGVLWCTGVVAILVGLRALVEAARARRRWDRVGADPPSALRLSGLECVDVVWRVVYGSPCV
jgi:uncharacterized protein YjeT (DUF2065 family)